MGFERKTHVFTPGSAACAKCLGVPEFRAHIPGPGPELERVPGVLPSSEEVMGCCVHLLERQIIPGCCHGRGKEVWSPSLEPLMWQCEEVWWKEQLVHFWEWIPAKKQMLLFSRSLVLLHFAALGELKSAWQSVKPEFGVQCVHIGICVCVFRKQFLEVLFTNSWVFSHIFLPFTVSLYLCLSNIVFP